MKTLFVLVAVALLAGCGSADYVEQEPNQRTTSPQPIRQGVPDNNLTGER